MERAQAPLMRQLAEEWKKDRHSDPEGEHATWQTRHGLIAAERWYQRQEFPDPEDHVPDRGFREP